MAHKKIKRKSNKLLEMHKKKSPKSGLLDPNSSTLSLIKTLWEKRVPPEGLYRKGCAIGIRNSAKMQFENKTASKLLKY